MSARIDCEGSDIAALSRRLIYKTAQTFAFHLRSSWGNGEAAFMMLAHAKERFSSISTNPSHADRFKNDAAPEVMECGSSSTGKLVASVPGEAGQSIWLATPL